jgi:hypothetical protein
LKLPGLNQSSTAATISFYSVCEDLEHHYPDGISQAAWGVGLRAWAERSNAERNNENEL